MREGLQYKFPFDTEQRDYDYFDAHNQYRSTAHKTCGNLRDKFDRHVQGFAVALLKDSDWSSWGAELGQRIATHLQGSAAATVAASRRLPLLPEIAGLYDELRFEAERVVKAKVTSAVALPAEELATLAAALKRRFGRDVEVETAVDASLIGGAVIDAGDVVIDGSLKGCLLYTSPSPRDRTRSRMPSSA